MMPAIERYLALRRATGFQLSNAEYLLGSFARFAAARNEAQRPSGDGDRLGCPNATFGWLP